MAFLTPINSPSYYDCNEEHTSIDEFHDIFESSVDDELIETIKLTPQGLNVEPWVLKVYRIYYDYYQQPFRVFSAYHYINTFWGHIEHYPSFMNKVIKYLEENYLDSFETTPQNLQEFFVNINEVVLTSEVDLDELSELDTIRILKACS